MERAILMIALALGGIQVNGQFTVLHSGAAGSSLEDIHFPTTQIGYATGKDGALYKSDDGGVTWNAMSTGSGAYLFGVHFLDENTGFVSGGGATVLRTTDGGANCTPLTLPFTECVYQVQPITASVIHAAGWGGFFFRSTDAGDNWTISSIDPNWQGWVFGMHFRDDLNGVVAQTDGRIYHTSNGGLDWTQATTTTSNALRGISMGDATTGFAAGFFGTVQKTVDGGTNWSTVNSGYPDDSYYGVHFTDALNGVICGGFYTGGNWQGVIMRTDDGGASWDRIHTGGPVLNGITINDGSIFAVGTNEVIVSDVLSTSVEEPTPHERTIVSPNPFSDRIIITSTDLIGTVRFELISLVGDHVLSGATSTGSIGTEAVRAGCYVLLIENANGVPLAKTLVVKL